MCEQEGTKLFYLNQIFLEAMKVLEAEYCQRELKIEFIPPNRVKVFNWADGQPSCAKFQTNFKKTLQSVNVMKLNQPQKKIDRIRVMNKWKRQFQIKGLNVLMLKKNYGNAYYLMGCATQLQLYQVLMNLQVHSYKTFSGNFVKFLYKPVLELLINSRDFRIVAYEKLKITSTQMRIVTLQTQNKKKVKYVQLLFQLQVYISTKLLVNLFKQFLSNQFFICALTFGLQRIQDMKKTLQKSSISAWKVHVKPKQHTACAYVIFNSRSAKQKVSDILNECLYIEHMSFLRNIGKMTQKLQLLVQYPEFQVINSDQQFILDNFYVKGNFHKNPNQISVKIRQQKDENNWIQFIKKMI